MDYNNIVMYVDMLLHMRTGVTVKRETGGVVPVQKLSVYIPPNCV